MKPLFNAVQQLKWTILIEWWKATEYGHKASYKLILNSSKVASIPRPPSIFGSVVLTHEFLPMKSVDLSQEKFLCIGMWPINVLLQTSTSWLYYNLPFRSWRFRTSSLLGIKTVEESRLHSKNMIMALFRHGCPISGIWGGETNANWCLKSRKTMRVCWSSWMWKSRYTMWLEFLLCSGHGAKVRLWGFTGWFINWITAYCETWE